MAAAKTATAVWKGDPGQLAAIKDAAMAKKMKEAAGGDSNVVYGLITLLVLMCICCTSVGGFLYMKFLALMPDGAPIPEKGEMYVPTFGVKIVDIPSRGNKDKKMKKGGTSDSDDFDIEATPNPLAPTI